MLPCNSLAFTELALYKRLVDVQTWKSSNINVLLTLYATDNKLMHGWRFVHADHGNMAVWHLLSNVPLFKGLTTTIAATFQNLWEFLKKCFHGTTCMAIYFPSSVFQSHNCAFPVTKWWSSFSINNWIRYRRIFAIWISIFCVWNCLSYGILN